MKVRLGCRGSELSLAMAELVTKKLEQLDCTVEIIPIKSDEIGRASCRERV